MNLRTLGMLLVVGQAAFGAFEKQPQGSRSVGMGGSLVGAPGDEWGVFCNPGVLPTIGERTVSLFYSPRMFGLKELARSSLSYIEPSSIGTVAVSATTFGFALYREVGVTVSYARGIGERCFIGANISYYSLSIQQYGSAGAIGVDAGFLVRLSPEVHWGMSAFNINAPKIGEAKEKLPQALSTGLSYTPIPDALIAVALVKDISFPTEFGAGVQYTVLALLDLRVGTTTDPSTLNAGIGLRYSFVRLDYAFSSHPELGMTHQVSLTLRLGDL